MCKPTTKPIPKRQRLAMSITSRWMSRRNALRRPLLRDIFLMQPEHHGNFKSGSYGFSLFVLIGLELGRRFQHPLCLFYH